MVVISRGIAALEDGGSLFSLVMAVKIPLGLPGSGGAGSADTCPAASWAADTCSTSACGCGGGCVSMVPARLVLNAAA